MCNTIVEFQMKIRKISRRRFRAVHWTTQNLRYWQTRTHCRGHIVAHDVSWAAQTGKHLLRTQSVSEQNQKHFLCPGHKNCVRNKCCARGQTGKALCRQQSVRNNVSSFASTFSHFTLLFCRGRQRNVQRFMTHVHSHCSLSLCLA